MKYSVQEAQWCQYCHKHDTAGGILLVEQQVEREEEPEEEIINAET